MLETGISRRAALIGAGAVAAWLHSPARALLQFEVAPTAPQSVQVPEGFPCSARSQGELVIFETESGRIVTDEIYVRTQVGYEVRTEVVGERGSATIGLDQNLQVKTADGRWGGRLTPSFVERFGAKATNIRSGLEFLVRLF